MSPVHTLTLSGMDRCVLNGCGSLQASTWSDRVCFRGWMPQQECVQHLRSATALLLPSIKECGGAVVLEAMATGTPVIAVAWGGPEDYLDETCGILIPPLNAAAVVDGFTAGMRKLIDNPELSFSLGAAARRKIEAKFSWEEKVAELSRYTDVP